MKQKMGNKLMLITLMSLTLPASAAFAADTDSDRVITSEVGGVEYSFTFEEAPQHAVSSAGYTTEMMLALGLEKQMAGTAYPDNEIDPQFQEAYDSIPLLSEKYPSQEQILDVETDFVTGWLSVFAEDKISPTFLEKNNISFYVPLSDTDGAGIDEVYADFRNLGIIFQVEEKAEEVISSMQEQIAAINEKVSDEEVVKVFLYDSGEDAPFTAGGSLPTDLISLAGGENIFGDETDKWLTVQWEAVIDANPEWVVVMTYSGSEDAQAKIDFMKNTPALQDIEAVKKDQFLVLGLQDVTAGLRNIGAVQTMAEQFHPEAFEE